MENSSKPMPAENVELVVEHIDFARKTARQFFYDRRHLGVDLEDFEGAALLGLCDAACRYDRSKGMAFQTFCFFRVRGAMYDLLRRGSGIPRRQYARLVKGPNREADDAASEGAASTLPYAFARNSAELGSLASIIEEVGIRLQVNADNEVIGISYARDADPEAAATLANTRRYLQKLMARLPERERRVLELKYFEGQTFDEIRSSMYGTSKSWISRLHSRALNNLKAVIIAEATEPERELMLESLAGGSLYDHLG